MTYLPADVLNAVAAKGMASFAKQIQDDALAFPFGPEREQVFNAGNAWWRSFWSANLPALYDIVAAEIPEHPRDSEAYKIARLFGETFAKDTRTEVRAAIPATRAYKLADEVLSRDFGVLKGASWSPSQTRVMRLVLIRLGVQSDVNARTADWERALMVWCNVNPVEYARKQAAAEAEATEVARVQKEARDAERFAELYPGLLGQAIREGAVSKLHAAKLTNKTYRYGELDGAILTEPAAVERLIAQAWQPAIYKPTYSGPLGGEPVTEYRLRRPDGRSIADVTATGYDFARWLWNRAHPDDIIPPRPKSEPKPKKRDDWRW